MFKNAALFRIGVDLTNDPSSWLCEQLEEHTFTPCGASQERSVGWVPPRGEAHGPLCEHVAGQWILKLMIESKRVPSDVLQRTVAEQCQKIEAGSGRKPGKRERKEITEDVKLALLPMVFPTRASVLVWIDPVAKLLLIDTASTTMGDEVVTQLVRAIEGFTLQHMLTEVSPAAAMAHWLASDEYPAGFTLDRACELHAPDESKAKVKYSNHALDIPEIRQHLAAGKLPVRLGMTHEGRVSFTLTEGLVLKGLAFLDGVFTDPSQAEHADGFDADISIATGELQRLIPDLLAALGGESSVPATT